jgi:fatty acid desaturase
MIEYGQIGSLSGSTSPALSSPAPQNPRASMRVLPRFLQPVLTWLTGQPLPEQRPWRLRPAHHLLASVAPLVVGVGLGGLLLQFGWWALLMPVPWLLTTHGMRKLRAVILHQCSHGNFLRKRWPDKLLGYVIAVLFITQEYADYKREHVSDHHSVHHMTMRDPTVQFLIIGLKTRPGMTRRQLWYRLWITILSPRYHVTATYSRLASHFRNTPIRYRALMVVVLAAQALLVTLADAWLVFSIVWLVPLTILFNASAAIRVCTRHLFPEPGVVLIGKEAIASHTHGIFLGEEVPDMRTRQPQRFLSWMRWWTRMAFVHLPARLFVMVGDAPCHDYHHRFPRSPHWANYLFARQQDMEQGHADWPPYTEVWGMATSINAVFDTLRSADPKHYTPATVPDVSPREFLIFEE